MEPDKEKGDIDLSKILLPKKEGPSKDSAQRINAGALLEAEQAATLPKPEAKLPPAIIPKKEEPGVRPIETYQGDIESLVQSKNVSVLSIAAAEAMRRGQNAAQQGEASAQESHIDIAALARRAGMIMSGVVLLVGAVGVLWWVMQPPKPVDVQTAEVAPFIKVDATKVLTVPTGPIEHKDFIQALALQRDTVSLSLGLIERLQLAVASTTPQGQTLTPLTATTFLTYLSPSVPDTLLRAIEPAVYLLGVHSFDGNQSLLILEADSYEAAYAGMLSWERSMRVELAPLFMRTPQIHIQERSVATSTVASSTASTTATSTPPEAVQPVQTGFVDRIVENHDVRAIENEHHDILMLWTFINRKVLVITTNEATLREVISRLKDPLIIPTP